MTNEEAIAIIRKEYLCVDRDCNIERSCGNCDLVMPSKEPILQAFKMAINALEQLNSFCTNCPTNLCDSCKYDFSNCEVYSDELLWGNGKDKDNVCACKKYKALEQEPSEDAISRQAVLDKCITIAPIILGDDIYYDVVLVEDIKSLPSVTPAPSEDAISRREAINIAYDWSDVSVEEQVKRLNDLPPVTPARPEGVWIGIDDEPHEDWECSCCGGMVWAMLSPYDFCPNCGADMRGET